MDTRTFGSIGGNARTLALTPEQRSEAAKKAAQMRWGKPKEFGQPKLPLNAICGTDKTVLKFGNIEVAAYVLEDGRRVLSGKGMQDALGFAKNESGLALKRFLSTDKLKGFLPEEVLGKFDQKIEFKRPGSGGAIEVTYGFEATLLIDLCDVILQGKNAGALTTENQLRLAKQADIIVRSVAKVGIIALVDEVTGYQKQKNEYQQLLEAYIEKELRPWMMTFEDNYYKQIYRLLGWNWDAFRGNKKNHPSCVGGITNRIIYEKLPPGVIEALKELNPKNDHGNRENRHHQYLTENIGYRHLIKHITAVTTIMEMFPDNAWKEALYKIDTRFPTQRLPKQLELNLV